MEAQSLIDHSPGVDQERIGLFMDVAKGYGIFLLDNDGRIVSCNDAAAQLFGYRPEDVIGFHVSRFDVPEEIDDDKPAMALERVGAVSQVIVEAWQVRADGSRFWASMVTTALRDADARPKGFVHVLRDISERKHLELELKRQAKQLAEAERRKDEFLAMLSHELRNPLGPVWNSVRVIQQSPHDPAAVKVASNVVEKQMRHMARLIDDLLEVTRVSRGKLEVHLEPTDLCVVVKHAIESMNSVMIEHAHFLETSFPNDPIHVNGDPVRLEQVVVNLLDNAAKFTESGGKIRLSLRQEGQAAILTIADNGIGIGPDLRPRIFDLFTQAETKLDRSRGGLGIGLTLVKSLVKMHGGRIDVISDGEGLGAEFTMRLPVLADVLPTPHTPQANHRHDTNGVSQGEPLRILVVDDNVDMATSLSILMRLHSHAVDVAYDGEQALGILDRDDFDVVFLDIGLPRIDGYEVARRVRSKSTHPQPILMAISGYGQESDKERARAAGFDLFLVKPVDPTELEGLLDRLARKSAQPA